MSDAKEDDGMPDVSETTVGGKGAQSPPAGMMIPTQNWVLSVPRGVKAQLTITGADVKPEDLKRLKSQIDFLVDSLNDGAGV